MKTNVVSKPVKQISRRELAFLFTTLSDLLKVGFSEKDSFSFLLVVIKKNKKELVKITEMVERGFSIPEALYPYVPPMVYQQLLIANQHGSLIKALEEIATFLDLELKQSERIKSVIMYPIFLFGILFSIILALKCFILPKTADLAGKKASDGFPVEWVVLFVLIITVVATYCILQYRKRSYETKISFLVHLPLLGGMFASYYQYFLATNLSIMIKSGMDLKRISRCFLTFNPHTILYLAGQKMKESLNQGISLAECLGSFPFVSNEMVIFLKNGSSQSELANNLAGLAGLSYKRLVIRAERLIKSIQPVAFVIIGVLVVLTYLQMLLPMYDSMKGIY